jgi:hypothetical protein
MSSRDRSNGDDNNDGLSPETAFATIQKGIDTAEDSNTVLVYPGVYTEEIDFLGKAITVRSAADAAVLEAPGDFAVSFYSGEGPGSILKNFVIRNNDRAIFIAGSSPTISNLTIVDNQYGITAYAWAEPDISNCIFWNNTDGDLFQCEARYSFFDSTDLTDRLVAYYPFNGNANDESGSGHHGTPVGPILVEDRRGMSDSAYYFDGIDDYIRVDHAEDLNFHSSDDFSITVWVKVLSHSGLGDRIIEKKQGGDNGYSLSLTGPGTLDFTVEGDNTAFHAVGFTNLVDGRYHHVVGVRDGKNGLLRCYVDALEDASPTNTEGIVGSFGGNAELNIGKRPGYYNYYLNGVVDEVRIYDRALSAGEVEQLYQNQPSTGPMFADPSNGDYHLRSERGRYWPQFDLWVLDKVTSLCVDGGDPTADYSNEPVPNGGRINMGAYGGTAYASMSEGRWLEGDINRDHFVNMMDMALVANDWLKTTLIGVDPKCPVSE